jgi:zinc-ribbon domain
MHRPHWRKMTWLILVWCAVILVWAVAVGSASNQCSRTYYQNACDTGVGIGVALILVIGFIGFVFLSLIWLMSGRRGRDCPACGNSVRRGKTVCPSCGHDFAAAAGDRPSLAT